MDFVGQKRQDRWVVEEALPGLRGGYFLDLAATNGVSINNTLVLERELSWTGIAIEPNAGFFADLVKNRRCICAQACVDEKPGKVTFMANGELGGIVDDDTDNSPAIRAGLLRDWERAGRLQTVQAETLAGILEKYQAPRVIHYFSFDVEGAETRILRSFPFDRYTFLAVTIERPTPEINEIMARNDYLFVKNFSFDSFYIHQSNPVAPTIKRDQFEQVPPKDW